MMKHRIPLLLIGFSVVIALMTLGYVFYSTQSDNDDATGLVGEQSTQETVVEAGTQTPASPSSEAEQADNESVIPANPFETDVTFNTIREGINQARVRPDGTAVIAGLAPPGSTIRLLNNGTIIGETIASDKGDWVIVPESVLEPGPHLLSIEIITPDGEAQIGAMALAIELSGRDDEIPLVALVPFTPEAAGATQVLQTPDDDLPGGDASETAEAAESAEIAAAPEPPPQSPTVTIRTIEASPDGDIIVTGTANTGADSSGGGVVFIRLDGQGIATTASSISRVVDGGYTAMMPIDNSAERFRISVILQDDNGRKLAQARITLTRAKINQALGDNALVVIHRGDALWRIAYRTYGEGLRFVDIYRQNRDQITDPDLIYPDQVLVVPNP